jgi:hypothetical protein
MPFKAEEYGPLDRIYSYVGDDGRAVNVDSVKLRAWCMMEARRGNLLPVLVPVDGSLGQQWLKDGTVIIQHCFDLLDYPSLDPIIFGAWPKPNPPDHILIDGHHRYTLLAMMNEPHIPAFVLPELLWRPFEIIGLKPVSKEGLRNFPTTPNSYRPENS